MQFHTLTNIHKLFAHHDVAVYGTSLLEGKLGQSVKYVLQI